MRMLPHRVGALEIAHVELKGRVDGALDDIADMKLVVRELERFKWQLMGMAIAGASIGGWILSQLSSFVNP